MSQDDLFETRLRPGAGDSEELFEEEIVTKSQPVICLGREFENDEARRAFFTEELRKKLQDPEFRKIEGFPIGEDEDILALSDPPYFTACPNPWIADFIKEWEAQKPPKPAGYKYHREPFAADVSEGKNDPIYNAHSYHTKVPHKAVMRFILHYTEPGDIVFDGFCGTGMTGVAAQMCGKKAEVESLGYRVQADGTILKEDENEEGKKVWVPFSKLGARRAILNDLSPAATFIAYNYNTPVNVEEFEREAHRILAEVEAECGWMYTTLIPTGEPDDPKWKQRVQALANEVRKTTSYADLKNVVNNVLATESSATAFKYMVWSDIFSCPECGHELIYWEVTVDEENRVVRDCFPCPSCGSELTKRSLERIRVTHMDRSLGKMLQVAKQVPVVTSAGSGRNRRDVRCNAFDEALASKLEQFRVPYQHPMVELPQGYNTKQPLLSHGASHTHHFYTRRNLWVLSAVWHRLRAKRNRLPFLFTASLRATSKMASIAFTYYFNGGGGFVNAGTKGTLYISSNNPEVPVLKSLKSRVSSMRFISSTEAMAATIATESMTSLSLLPSQVVDYVFLDPPFGANINYSELNTLWEHWLGVLTNQEDEAVHNEAQGKDLISYSRRMTASFRTAFRVLKPGGWATIEFSNTKAAVWNMIQLGLSEAGFVIANVAGLDKKQNSFKAYTTPTAVKQDLVISAYKPNGGLEERFENEKGTVVGVWDFIDTHLRQLPVFVLKKGRMETIAERTANILYDRLVAFHVVRSAPVPVSAAEFFAEMEDRYAKKDGMFFLRDQLAEYEKKRARVEDFEQMELFVRDEATAIEWLKARLKEKPQQYSEIQPDFMPLLSHLGANERDLISLDMLLEENCLCYEGKGPVPEQIHAYLSTNWKDLRNLPKDDPALIAKAKNRWYVPDPKKAGDVEKLREKALLKEFEAYKASKKKLKIFRLEAVRAGFKRAWQDRDYATIVSVADKIPSKILEEDPKLLMWYDQAVTRLGADNQ